MIMVTCARCGLRFYCVTRVFKICIWCEAKEAEEYLRSMPRTLSQEEVDERGESARQGTGSVCRP